MGAQEEPEELSDDQLFAAWKGGDESAFAQILDRHGPPVHRFLRSYLGDARLAEDAWSQTFLKVVRARERYVPQGNLRAWLLTIARRAAMDLGRGRRRWLRLLDRSDRGFVEVTPTPTGEVLAIENQRRHQLQQALGGLSPQHRSIVLLTYEQDLNSSEVAEILGISAQQVRSRLTYARRLLAERMGESA